MLDALRRKITSGRPTLCDVYGPILYGIKTGFNDAFVLNRATRDALLGKDPSSADLLKPFLVGEDLKRWRIESDDKWLIYTPKNRVDIDEYPAVREHLRPFRDRLERRATRQKWFELQQAQASCETWFRQEKLVYPEMSQGPKFSFDTQPHYVSNKVFYIGTTHRGTVALLGSKPLWLIMFGETSPLRGGQWRLEFREHRMRALPVFRNEQLLELAELARQIQDTYEIRRHELISFMDRAADLVQDRHRVVFANWSDWDFRKFRNAVQKAAATDIPVSERDEWQAYFDMKKLGIAGLDTELRIWKMRSTIAYISFSA